MNKSIKSIIEKLKNVPIFIDTNLYSNHRFEMFFNQIIDLYKEINLKKCKIETKKEKLLNESGCNFFDLFTFLNNQNILEQFLETYDQKEIYTFKSLIESKNFDGCCEWINTKGKFFMREIFKLIQNECIKRKIIPQSILDNLNRIDKDIYGEFTSLEVIDEIETFMEYKLYYKISYKNININLTIYNKNKNIRESELELIIKRVIFMSLLKQKQTNGKSISINLVLIMSNKKKILSDKGITLGPNEINSGVSTYSYNENYRKVVIYRKEELNKLIIHELIHNLTLDFIILNYDSFDKIINIDPQIQITFNESYTELMACLINAILCSFEYKRRKNRKLACNYINNELNFNLYQVGKILVNYNFNHSGDFFCPYKDTKFRQNTNVFSYFIIKTSLLLNCHAFLDFFFEQNVFSKKLENNSKAKEYYIKLVKNSLLNEKYHNVIDIFIKYILHNKQNKKMYSTLRMTITE